MTRSTDPLSSDEATYALFKTLSPKPLPANREDDPLAVAEALDRGEASSDLGFLLAPLDPAASAPESLKARAAALAPRQKGESLSVWRRWRMLLAAALTFVGFGSGSYALASTLVGPVEAAETQALSDPLEQSELGIFEAGSDLGLLTYEEPL